MANLTKDQILAALPGLSNASLRTVQGVIGSLLGEVAISSAKPASEPVAWLYDALSHHIGARQSLSTFKATAAGKQFMKNAPIAISFIQTNFKGALENKVKAHGLMRHLTGILLADMKAGKIPITRNTVTANLHRMNDAFERAYPNYIQSGLAVLVLKAILNKK